MQLRLNEASVMFMIHRVTACGLLFLIVYLHNLESSDGIRLQECQSGVVEFVENSISLILTCTDYGGDTVTWVYQTPSSAVSIILGTCSATSCLMNLGIPSLFFLTQLTSSSSQLTVTITRRNAGGILYRCGASSSIASCRSDNIVPAVTGPARVIPVRAQGGWMLHGSVNITRVYSSLGRYACRWYQRTGPGPDNVLSGVALDLSPDPTNSTNTADRAGSCFWSGVMPNDTGTYTYGVVVSPPTNATTGAEVDLAIVRPLAPVASCIPSPNVLENTSIHCTCSTENIGEPAGRLVWHRNSNVLSYGNYSDVKLNMPPQTLKLSDHGVTQFRCDVEWAFAVAGNVITANVGYAPTATDLNISPSTANKNQAVTIDCHADGRPTPNMTLVRQDKNVVVRTGPSPLSYTISSAQCEDNAVYVCTASNGMGPDQEDTASLIVKCKPQIETIPLPDVIFKLNDHPVTFSFDVTAYPVPDNFTFTFVTPNSSVKTSASLSQDVAMNAACVAKSGSLYRAACSVTVPALRSQDEVGVYRLRVANSQGYQDYAFQIRTVQTGEQTGSSSAESARSAAVGLGVALAVVLVTIVIIVLWLWRRDWTLPCSETAKGEDSDHRLSASRDTSMKENHQTPASYSTPAEQTGRPYDSLQMQDVGLRSPYAEISYHGDR